MPTIKFASCTIALLCGWFGLVGPCLAEESVTATLRDGRSVTGAVDVRTDAQNLWLRRTRNGFELVSGFAWNDVLEGRAGNQQFDMPGLRSWAETNKKPGRTFAQLPAAGATNLPAGRRLATTSAHWLKTLVVQGQLAQWDKDAQPDGLRIAVSPLDHQGRIVPIDGHVEFTLVVEQARINGGQSYAKLRRQAGTLFRRCRFLRAAVLKDASRF
jgi:hypothetical protein